ncbi:MAG: ABC transporter ATP-binding protein [Bacteroidota bacterium]|jgi:lipopolysaccharide transport system ATP-binding protein
MSTVIKVENLSKQYRLGDVGTGTLSHDLKRWWYKTRGKEDPYLQIGEVNDRSTKGESDYVWALRDINFEVKAGEVLGIIGRNGAGKSTLLKILSKTTTPTTGSVKVKGRIASLLEVGTGFHPELTGRENIFLNGAILGMTKREIQSKFDEIVDFSGVERYIDTPVKRYSSGMYVRLAFAVAAHLEPEILIVDEVLAVGDLDFQKKALGKMKNVSEVAGRTVLFVSHNMPSVRNLCTKGIMLLNGKIDFLGNSDQVVDYYINNMIEFNTKFAIDLHDEFRLFNHNRNIEFNYIEFLNPQIGNQYAVDDPISFFILLKGNKSISQFRIAVGISTIEETTVGVFFSESKFEINEGEVKMLKITFNNHQLAKGQYYFDFSVGIGNEITGFQDFDHVTKTLFFEIAFANNSKSEMITVWDRNWGKINFRDVQISY